MFGGGVNMCDAQFYIKNIKKQTTTHQLGGGVSSLNWRVFIFDPPDPLGGVVTYPCRHCGTR